MKAANERMEALEDEMCMWNAQDPSQRSPNDIDALVYSFYGLGLCNITGGRVTSNLRGR
jgi:phage terminase large subunit-like protein